MPLQARMPATLVTPQHHGVVCRHVPARNCRRTNSQWCSCGSCRHHDNRAACGATKGHPAGLTYAERHHRLAHVRTTLCAGTTSTGGVAGHGAEGDAGAVMRIRVIQCRGTNHESNLRGPCDLVH